jgi:RNA polymerase sigma-70 factor (ECF subfamily)
MEEKLIKKAKEGDNRAIEELYTLHRPFVFNYIMKRVKHTQDAEDLTSLVFLRAFEKIHQYTPRQGQGGFVNWLAIISHNAIVDMYRKRKVQIVYRAELPEHLFGKDIAAEQEALDEMGRLDFRKYLAYCTPQQAEVIRMKYEEDLSNEQIAGILGTSVGAVKSMQHRAFDNIKEGLAA